MTDLPTDYQVWPLRRGETLSNHDWFPFFGHKFLGSGFLAKSFMAGNRDHVATALVLWCEAMRQDPAGTLPMDDVELASLARFASVDEWMACRDAVLHGWEPVAVEDDRQAEPIFRLGHSGLILKAVDDMARRKRGRDGAREAGRAAVRKSRIRKQMRANKVPDHMIADERIVQALNDYFVASDLFVTADHVRDAMASEIGYPQIARFPRGQGGAS